MERVRPGPVGHFLGQGLVVAVSVEAEADSRPHHESGRVVVALRVFEDGTADGVRHGEPGHAGPGAALAAGIDGGYAPVERPERTADQRIEVGNAAPAENVGAAGVAAKLDVIPLRTGNGVPEEGGVVVDHRTGSRRDDRGSGKLRRAARRHHHRCRDTPQPRSP
jgi:hypothetical protein